MTIRPRSPQAMMDRGSTRLRLTQVRTVAHWVRIIPYKRGCSLGTNHPREQTIFNEVVF